MRTIAKAQGQLSPKLHRLVDLLLLCKPSTEAMFVGNPGRLRSPLSVTMPLLIMIFRSSLSTSGSSTRTPDGLCVPVQHISDFAPAIPFDGNLGIPLPDSTHRSTYTQPS